MKLKRIVPWFLNELCLQKYDFYRELNPLERIYDVFHLSLFCFISQNGFSMFYRKLRTVELWGIYYSIFVFIYGCIAFFSVMCYAEMAALMPSTGAAYHYCYYSLGEFIAFLAGWNIIFGQAVAVVARWSFLMHFCDKEFFNNWIEKNLSIPKYHFHEIFIFGGTIDFALPCALILLATFSTVLAKKGKNICSALTCMCIFIGLVFSIILSYHMKIVNTVSKKRSTSASAAKCLVNAAYSFFGFEVISVLGEETINPTETIPKSLLISMKWTYFFSVIWTGQLASVSSGIITDPIWPMRALIKNTNLQPLEWLALFGTVCGTLGSIYASFFLLLRIIYAMSRDGLLCSFFSKVDRYTNSPFFPAVTVALVLSVLGIIISFGTHLFQPYFYSLIGTKIVIYVCLLYTRYEYKQVGSVEVFDTQERWVLFNWPKPQKTPTPVTHRISMRLIFIVVLSSFLLVQTLMAMRAGNKLDYPWLKLSALFAGIVLIASLVLLSLQPQNDRSKLKYRVPDVPFIPVIAMIFDFIVCLNEAMVPRLWIPLIIWWTLGVILYFSFSFKNSNQRRMMNPDGTKWEIMNLGQDDFRGVSRTSSLVDLKAGVDEESSSGSTKSAGDGTAEPQRA